MKITPCQENESFETCPHIDGGNGKTRQCGGLSVVTTAREVAVAILLVEVSLAKHLCSKPISLF